MTAPDAAPKELGELLSFLCALGRLAHEAYEDDQRITLLEAAGLVTVTREGVHALRGLEAIPVEVRNLTPEQMRRLADIPAHHFRGLLPPQQEVIVLAGLACLPSLVNFFQTIRHSAALAAQTTTATPRATPA